MTYISKVGGSNRAVVPGPGLQNNLFVRSGDFDPLVDRINSIASDAGVIGIAGSSISIASRAAFTVSTLQNRTTTAINSTATATAAQILNGAITSTSGAATTITLPTATLLATALGASQGSSFDLFIDNTAGANTVTIALGTGMAQAVIVPNGGTGALTVAASATLGVGCFRIYFSSTTTAVVSRII